MNQLRNFACQCARMYSLLFITAYFPILAMSQVPCESTVKMGESMICLPRLTGYHEVIHSSLADFVEKDFGGFSEHLYGFYLTNSLYKAMSDLERAPKNDAASQAFNKIPFDDYYWIYSLPLVGDVEIDEFYLEPMSQVKENDYTEITWESMKTILDGKPSNDVLAEPKLLERYQPHPKSRSIVTMSYEVTEEASAWMVQIINTLLIQKHIVFVSYDLYFKDESTIATAKSRNDAFVKLLLTANP
jgi:hypothetical protein